MAEEIVKETEIKRKGLSYCQEYLGGPWLDATLENFEMIHIKGGLTNLLYRCKLLTAPFCGDQNLDTPTTVILRIYGRILSDVTETILNDSVIFTLLAERKMGPRLYGVFGEGRIEEFLQCKPLGTPQLRIKKISHSCARVMALFHGLQMPLAKQPKWLFYTIKKHLNDLKKLYSSEMHNLKSDQQRCLKTLMSYDLDSELIALQELTKEVNSPVVFCHNDLQEGNILLLEGESRNGFQHSELVQPIDFEYASYNYRGFDIGNHFCEWCYDYKVPAEKGYAYNLDDYPNKQQQIEFAVIYLATWKEGMKTGRWIHQQLPQNIYLKSDNSPVEVMKSDNLVSPIEIEKLLLEANTFALASHFLWGLWSIVQAHISKIEFGYLDYAMDRFDAYFKQKEKVQIAVNNYKNGT